MLDWSTVPYHLSKEIYRKLHERYAFNILMFQTFITDDFKLELRELSSKGLSLDFIGVHEDKRNKGVATEFLTTLQTFAEGLGYEYITLTPCSNFGKDIDYLKGFYQKFGFIEKPFADEPKMIWFGSKFQDTYALDTDKYMNMMMYLMVLIPLADHDDRTEYGEEEGIEVWYERHRQLDAYLSKMLSRFGDFGEVTELPFVDYYQLLSTLAYALRHYEIYTPMGVSLYGVDVNEALQLVEADFKKVFADDRYDM